MATIKLDGFPTGQATVSASEDGSAAQQATGDFVAPVAPAEDAVYYAQDAVLSDRMCGIQYNMASDFGNGTRFAGGYAPCRYSERLDPADITQIAGNRIHAHFNKLTNFDLIAGGALDDEPLNPSIAQVYRATNGALQLVRESRVVSHVVNDWKTTLASGQRIGAGNTPLITGTSFTVGFFVFTKPNHTIHFGVAAVVQGSLQWGQTAHIPYTTPSVLTNTGSSGGTTPISTVGFSQNTGLAAPTNLTATAQGNGSSVLLSWDPVAGADGYVIFQSDSDPAGHTGVFIDLEDDGGTQVQTQTDKIYIRKTVTRPSINWVSPRIWTLEDGRADFRSLHAVPDVMPDEDPDIDWRLVNDHPGIGSHSLEVTLNNSKSFTLGRAWAASIEQSFYEVLDPSQTYRLSIWLKASEPRTLTFNPDLKDGVNPQGTFNVTTDWQQFTFDFQPAALHATGSQISIWRLALTSDANGVVYNVANPLLYLLDSVAKPYEMKATDLAQHGNIYGHRLQANSLCSNRGFTLDGLTNPAGEGGSAGRKETRTGGATITVQLNNLLNTGGELCYVTLDPSLTEQEILDLMEFLFAPAGAGQWADKRVALGRSDPWHTAFPRWRWEWMCEPWNQLFRPWSFVITDTITDSVTGANYAGGEYYQLWVNYLKSIMRSSPHWTADVENRMEWAIGGFHTIPQWAEGAWAHVPAEDMGLKTGTGIAKYLAGWELDYGTPLQNPEGYFQLLNFASLRGFYVDNGLAEANKVENGGNGHFMFTYEGGPGYNLNGLNGVVVTAQDEYEQERTTKSISGAAGNVANFMVAWEAGFDDLDIFGFKKGDYWSTHATWDQGGADYPFFQMLKLINEECVGEVRRVANLKVPVQFVPGQGNEPDVYDAPSVRVWQTRNGNRVCYIVTSATLPFDEIDAADPLFNANDNGVRSLNIQLPFASASSLTRYAFDVALDTNHHYTSHNVAPVGSEPEAKDIQIHQTSMTPVFPALKATISPAATHIYVFDGVS